MSRRMILTLSIIGALILAGGIATAGFMVTKHQVETAAADRCKAAVTGHAKFPGGVNFVTVEKEVMDDAEGWHFHGKVDFPNGFGTPVRHTWFCNSFVDGKVDDVLVVEGDW